MESILGPGRLEGQMVLIQLNFWLLSLIAGCCPLLRLAMGQTGLQLDLNQSYTNEETDIDFDLRI